ncbi:hypothetical protein [Pseudofrankia inefficax]|uniref:hypothetical protein n=1 Tax=Pseudofrankia inefficax (strain DSM 45817 / CECT 9037 / DDB 130130 / EuI1c) TaxID=298654 RepID=UPI0012FDBC08|nr:hypothetical protein [Pseudofrankia inefficax]
MIIGTRGHEAMRIAPFGRVGINTSKPDATLDVVGIPLKGLPPPETTALRATNSGPGFAGFFQGKVGVNGDLNVNFDINVLGDIKLVGGADLAEEFDVVGGIDADPGTVVVLAGGDTVQVSDRPYDRRVAGVVSGAGDLRPALILDRKSGSDRRPLALSGKVWCKVDADCGALDVGDLLTTSSTPGHAMRATDRELSFGSVIGKALGALQAGRGLIPVLVALQ